MSFYQQLEKAGLPTCNCRTHLYVLTETSAERNLLARLEFHEVVHYPLWHLDTQPGLEQYTPWLCVPEPDSDFDLWLGKAFKTMPMIIIFSRMSPDEVRRHLRHFSKFVDGTRRFILRLGTPSALQLYIASISHTPPAVSRFFADGEIEEMYFHDPQVSLSRRVQPLFEQQRHEEAECDGCLVWLDLPVDQGGLMMLNAINLDIMERLARKQADLQLSRYLCDTLAPLLPRLPSIPQCMPAFVDAAGKEALAAGYSDGRQYSTHIILSLLLGLGWQNDIHQATLNPILTAVGFPEPTRLNLAINTAITLRQQTERVMPQVHQVFLTLLSINPGALRAENIWRAFGQSASLYGINMPQRIQTLFETYEADALRQLALPSVKRRKYSAYEQLGLRHMTGQIPLPSDDLQHLQQHQLLCLGHHILLALSFGRLFYCNPLFNALHDGLRRETDPRQICHFLQQFLQQHQRMLMEEAYNDN